MSGVIPPRRALPRAIGSSPTSSCCCSAASKRLCSDGVGAVQHRETLEERIVHDAELRRRPRLAPGSEPVSDSGMPAAIAIPVRLPDITCSRRFSHPSERSDRAIEAGLENRLAVEVAARAVRDRHRVHDRELAGCPTTARSGDRPGARPNVSSSVVRSEASKANAPRSER